MDRTVSFSVPPVNKEAHEDIAKLRAYCKRTGISFSYLILKAIKLLNKELQL